MGAIQSLIQTLQTNVLTLIVPISVIGIALWAIAHGLAPLLPEWAQGMRGYFQRLCIAVAVAGFAFTFMTALYSIGGGR